MHTNVLVSPPVLLSWLSAEEKLRSIVLLDIEVDALDDGYFRFDLNIVFNQIPVRRGTIQQADYYVGTTGAEISTEFPDGSIRDYTDAHTLRVNHSNTTTRTRRSTVSITPEIAIKGQKQELAMKVGTVSWDSGLERTFTTMFSSEERVLTPVYLGNVLRWVLNLPRGEKAVRDFLLGNLYLYVECTWAPLSERAGRIEVRPSDVRFFDSEKRPIEKMASIAMLYILWRQGIKIRNRSGIQVLIRVDR